MPLAACATITRGSDEPVQFVSEPAGATVQTNIGLGCPATPCVIQVPRKDQFVATFDLPGHRSEQVMVATRMSGGGTAGLAGNAIFGGIIGVVVDANTGASMDHVPNPVVARLQPIRPVSPLIERRTRRRAPTS
ncbi:translation initiation factor 2 [Salinarimonas soli]|uniref:Translation initiation factor 2 n=2 Tax=Salinarimonas soli TaxID=1638099 RepID=A0A5B2V9L6_9HYPH|nr:translation initiation factor 2 [Salinarimonas soli]